MRAVNWGARRVRGQLLAAGAAGLALVAVAGPAAAVPRAADAGERITDMSVAFALRMDGSMHVTETITYDFGRSKGKHGLERYVPEKFEYDADRNRLYPITHVAAKSPSGAPDDVETTDPDVTVRIGDKDKTVSGVQTYVLDYDVAGVVNTVDGGQELYWNAVGQQWRVPVEQAEVTVTGPGAAVQRATCYQGAKGSTEPCTWSVSGGSATFRATRALPPGQGLTVVAGFPAGTFPDAAPILRDKWKFSKAFAASPVAGGTSLAILVLLAGGTGVLAARRGRDRRYLGLTPGLAPGAGDEERTGRVGWRKAPVAVQFTPPKELRVGELGTLIDEQANVEDVTATIIDLAVRGYLRIEEITDDDLDEDDDDLDEDDGDEAWDEETKAELARLDAELTEQTARREAEARVKAERRAARAARGGPGPVGATGGTAAATAERDIDDWVLVRTGKAPDDLREYEAELFDALFDDRERVRLSELRRTFNADLRRVQGMLYDEVTERGWFRGNPRTVRNAWRGYGITLIVAGIAATVLLAVFTHLALIGVASTLSGVVVLALAGRMPARTAAGTALLAQAQGFRLYLETAEANQIRFEEGQDVFSRYLPYAIVFGVAERWADLFARLAASGAVLPEPSWYVGYGPGWGLGGFDYHRFGGSMAAFSTETTSSISAVAPATPSSSGDSGFSGGFSGGGGGGGGGGSW